MGQFGHEHCTYDMLATLAVVCDGFAVNYGLMDSIKSKLHERPNAGCTGMIMHEKYDYLEMILKSISIN
jgi:hypothetical protein